MSLYTIILEFQGGTYVAQVYAESEGAAVLAWARNIGSRQIKGIGHNMKQHIVDMLQDEGEQGRRPVLLKELYNVWFLSLLIRSKILLINIIKTEFSLL